MPPALHFEVVGDFSYYKKKTKKRELTYGHKRAPFHSSVDDHRIATAEYDT